MADGPRALPPSLAAHPRLSSWLDLGPDGTFTLSPGKVEIGQGILGALAQIAAEELGVRPEIIRLAPAATDRSPNEGVTSGSLSISTCGMAVRQAAAEVRELFRSEASRRFGAPPDAVTLDDGVFRGPGNLTATYGELCGAVGLDTPATGIPAPLPRGQRRLVGKPLHRPDIAGRVYGRRPTIHDFMPPGLRFGRVLRPPRVGAQIAAFDEAAFAHAHPGVTLVRDGTFLGVVAATERMADLALVRLAAVVRWEGGAEPSTPQDLAAWLEAAPAIPSVVDRRGDAAPKEGVRIARSYVKPFLAHASIGPSCAVARWEDGRLRVWSHTQGVYNLRADLALVFGVPEADVTVEHAEGAGCYGHNGADDAALDAALLARACPGRPVRVQWSRSDELTASPFGAAMLMRMSATLAPDGAITDWSHELSSNGHTARPGRAATPALLAAWHLATPFPVLAASDPPLPSGGGAERNAVPGYDLPRWTITKRHIGDAPLRTSSMRSLGAIGNIFAIESFMDELAAAAGSDPLAFRLRHLSDPRAAAVLRRAAAMAGKLGQGGGRGIAQARYKNTGGYCAVVAEVEVDREPRVTRLWIAADIGEVINPDGARNQIEGGAVQAVSWALKEEVPFPPQASGGSWADYPILRFGEVPEVEVDLIGPLDAASLGAGEIAQGPTAAAIANAIDAALGVRIRRMPFTRERMLAAME